MLSSNYFQPYDPLDSPSIKPFCKTNVKINFFHEALRGSVRSTLKQVCFTVRVRWNVLPLQFVDNFYSITARVRWKVLSLQFVDHFYSITVRVRWKVLFSQFVDNFYHEARGVRERSTLKQVNLTVRERWKVLSLQFVDNFYRFTVLFLGFDLVALFKASHLRLKLLPSLGFEP